jgi:Flp pilus assembly protein protease CpaA
VGKTGVELVGVSVLVSVGKSGVELVGVSVQVSVGASGVLLVGASEVELQWVGASEVKLVVVSVAASEVEELVQPNHTLMSERLCERSFSCSRHRHRILAHKLE